MSLQCFIFLLGSIKSFLLKISKIIRYIILMMSYKLANSLN